MTYGHAVWIGNILLPPLGYAIVGRWDMAGWTFLAWVVLVVTGFLAFFPFLLIPVLWLVAWIHGITMVNLPRP